MDERRHPGQYDGSMYHSDGPDMRYPAQRRQDHPPPMNRGILPAPDER